MTTNHQTEPAKRPDAADRLDALLQPPAGDIADDTVVTTCGTVDERTGRQMTRTAWESRDGGRRRLEARNFRMMWEEERIHVWIRLRPSRSPIDDDDPAMKRMIDLTIAAGGNAVVAVNLYSGKCGEAQQPLFRELDAEVNAMVIELACSLADVIWPAWGMMPGPNKARARRRVVDMVKRAGRNAEWRSLGQLLTGDPAHPLSAGTPDQMTTWTPPTRRRRAISK